MWSLFIVISGVSEFHSLSFGRALAACIVPFAVLSVVLFFVLLLSVVLIASRMSYL